MEKKYIVFIGDKAKSKIYTKKEVYEEFFSFFVNFGEGAWNQVEVKNEKDAYKLMFKYEFDGIFNDVLKALEYFFRVYGTLENWKAENKSKIYKATTGLVKIYEICENELKEVTNNL